MRNFLFCTYPSSFLIEFFALLTFASCACCDWWWREIVLVFRLRFHHPLHFFVCLLSYLTMLSTTRDLALATLLLFNSFFPPRRYLCVCCCCFFLFSVVCLTFLNTFCFWDSLLSCFLFLLRVCLHYNITTALFSVFLCCIRFL